MNRTRRGSDHLCYLYTMVTKEHYQIPLNSCYLKQQWKAHFKINRAKYTTHKIFKTAKYLGERANIMKTLQQFFSLQIMNAII